MQISHLQACRIAYECARDLRDVGGGPAGCPWPDLTAEQQAEWQRVYAGLPVTGEESMPDIQFFRVVAQSLRSLIPL